MLVRLSPSQIMDKWPAIKEAAKATLPPIAIASEDALNNFQLQLLSEYVQCWVIEQSTPDKVTPIGVGFTTVTIDLCSGTRSLLIYGLFGFKPWRPEDWITSYRLISKYAKSVGCQTIAAYTKEPNIIEAAKKAGGNCDYRYVTLEVV